MSVFTNLHLRREKNRMKNVGTLRTTLTGKVCYVNNVIIDLMQIGGGTMLGGAITGSAGGPSKV